MHPGTGTTPWILLLAGLALAQPRALPAQELPPSEILTSKILDGSFVHDVGALQMNVTNFGLFGSFPGEHQEMSPSPSAQWPAGSGVEYLRVAGLWVGARINGLPRVSTAWPDGEFYPGDRPTDRMYSSFQGDIGGNRAYGAFPDDDADGVVDEDPLDGLDNDDDGRVDEDFAAIGNQMFRCRYRDDYPRILVDAPEHYPLGIEVTQESYQWEQLTVRDAVALDFTVKNVGANDLRDVYLGLYVDPEVGHRASTRAYDDDVVAVKRKLACLYRRPYNRLYYLNLVEAWDGDGDVDSEHPAPGRLGLLLLNTSTDVLGMTAPTFVGAVGWNAYHNFSRNAPFSEGGEAVSDDQRYELMSGYNFDYDLGTEGDWRYLVSTGPFQLARGDSIFLRLAFLTAEDEEALEDLAIRMSQAQEGRWYDLDGQVLTGRNCEETLLYDPVSTIRWYDPCSSDGDPVIVPKGTRLWVNADCQWEGLTNSVCENVVPWCSGTEGRETLVPWIEATAPPPPNLRVWSTEHANVLFWDSFSEEVPDGITGEYDFEGYRIWRADNWTRPLGSSEATGPSADLWMLLDETDLVNGLAPDRNLDAFRYQPGVDPTLVTWYTQVLLDKPWVEGARDYLPPVGFTLADADTAIGMARLEMGLPRGRRYYRFTDTNISTGLPYFYGVTAMDHVTVKDAQGRVVGLARGLEGSPSNGFRLAVPGSRSQRAWDYDREAVYVVPNPATPESMAPWALEPNGADPSGLKVEFRHLPAASCAIRIWTLFGDLVQTLHHDPAAALAVGDYDATGSEPWDLISRNGQEVASGVYLFTVDAPGFPRKVGKFTLIR